MREIIKTEKLICDSCGHVCNQFDDELWLCTVNNVDLELCWDCLNSVEKWVDFLNRYTEQKMSYRLTRKYDGFKDGTVHALMSIRPEVIGNAIGLMESFLATGNRSSIMKAIAILTVT